VEAHASALASSSALPRGGRDHPVHPEGVGNGARRLRRFNLVVMGFQGFSHPDAEAG